MNAARAAGWVVLASVCAAHSAACARASSPPQAAETVQAETRDEEAFSCEALEGLCDEAVAPSTQQASTCADEASCSASCQRGDASACLRAHELTRPTDAGSETPSAYLERACALGSVVACRRGGGDAASARDPRFTE